MIFLLRGDPPLATPEGARAVCERMTPTLVRTSSFSHDLFVVAERMVFDTLKAQGRPVFPVKDGWYEDDTGGGVAVWGAGEYWEVRSTPFEVAEAAGPGGVPVARGGEEMDVRGAIFGTVP